MTTAPDRRRIAVVGAGIVGAAIALSLAETGAQVTVLECVAPAAGATGKSFAWLNADVADPAYRSLRLRSMALWRELDALLGLSINWRGRLAWTDRPDEAERLRRRVELRNGQADDARMLSTAELGELSPGLQPGPVAAAFFASGEGHLEPHRVTRRLLDRARQRGAAILFPCKVLWLALRHGRLDRLVTSRGAIEADLVVIAAGTAAPALLAPLGYELPLRPSPGLLAHSQPIAPVSGLVHTGPGGLELRQTADGCLVGTDGGTPPGGGAMPELPDERAREALGQGILATLAGRIKGADAARFDRLTVGMRPMPDDGMPVVGAVPDVEGVYLAVTHSGITLAPVLGQLIARDVLAGTAADQLQPYRPSRFG